MQQLVIDHVGLRAFEPQPGENWIEQSRCWVTSPRDHPESIEFLRYEPDSTVPDVVKDNPHFAYRVADGKAAVRWVRAHARELGIDPQRIAAAGGSAGGHVAAPAAPHRRCRQP